MVSEENSSKLYWICGSLSNVWSISHSIIEHLFLFKTYVTPAATDPIATIPIPAHIAAGRNTEDRANSASIICKATVPPIPPPTIPPTPPPIPPPIAVLVYIPTHPYFVRDLSSWSF